MLHNPFSPITTLILELTRSLDNLTLMEPWLGLLPSRIGYSETIDRAATALIHATHYIYRPDRANRVMCHSSYQKALESLRHTLSKTSFAPPAKITSAASANMDDVLLTIALLACLECASEPGSLAMYNHIMGVNSILTTGPLFTRPTEAAVAVLYSHWMVAFQIPVAFGHASPFDTPAWLELEPMGSLMQGGDVARLRKVSYQLFIRLPHLIAQVRKLRSDGVAAAQSDEQAAWTLAEELRQLDGREMETSLLHRVQVKKTADAADARIIPYHLQFSGLSIFHPLVYYWQTRIVLNHIVLVINDMCPNAEPAISPDALKAENIRLATNLIMAWPYAFSAGRSGAWSMIIGWAAVWSTFRNETEFRGRPVTELHAWILQQSSWFYQYAVKDPKLAMDEAADVLLGGPLRGLLVDVFE